MDYPISEAAAVGLVGGKFSNGDPLAGVAPSLDRAEEMNRVYDELIAVVTAGGLTPDAAVHTQVRDAILAICNDLLSTRRPGEFILLAQGTVLPPRVLVVPTAATNISRTTYADLYAEIGTLYGAGDGVSTFGLPSLPPGYTFIQALNLAAIGQPSVGEILGHFHAGVVTGTPNTGSNFLGAGTPFSPSIGNTASTGGSANKAAGLQVRIGIFY